MESSPAETSVLTTMLRRQPCAMCLNCIHSVSNSAPTLTSCTFDKHGRILIIFFSDSISAVSKMLCLSLFTFTYFISLNSSDGYDALYIEEWRNEVFTDLDFADDVALLTEMLEVLVLAVTIMHEETAVFGLQINWSKTKIL